MRDQQLATFLATHAGFSPGLIGSDKPNERVSLSEVLETGPVPARYYLSPRAASGILRRAEKRGKRLPELLAQALLGVAGHPTQTG